MLRFIVAVLIIIVIFQISYENIYQGFTLAMVAALSFMAITINSIPSEDIDFKRIMMKTSEGANVYYKIINSK